MFTEEKKVFTKSRRFYLKDEKVTWTEEEQELLNDIETSTYVKKSKIIIQIIY